MPFKDIIGNKKLIQGLKRLIDEDHLPHALLFTGPEGIGKKLTALGLAKALFCKGSKNDYCGSCPSCKMITQGNHPDVTFIQPEGSSIKIEQMRQWQKTLESRPYLGTWRVTIIDHAEKMTQEAANSVLKVVEEPPDDTLICLIAAVAEDILPTIVSRCQIMRFSALNRSEFSQVLIEQTKMTEAQAGLVYKLSGGQLSKGLAMDLDELSKKRKRWRDFFRSATLEDTPGIKTDSASVLEGLDIMAHWVRDIILLKLGIEESLLTHQDVLGQLQEEAQDIPYSLAQSRIDNILQTIEAVERNANSKLALECLLGQWDEDL